MKGSLCVLAFFISGIVVGHFELLPQSLVESDISTWALWAMLIMAGMSMGINVNAWRVVRDLKGLIILVPCTVFIGTVLGSMLAWIFLDMGLRDVVAVGGGFGYYSLSSIIIGEFSGAKLASMALIANMSRELLTLLLAPFMVRYFGQLSSVASGGAASMDTCLPIITQSSGEHAAIIGIFSGMSLTFIVPFFITFLFS